MNIMALRIRDFKYIKFYDIEISNGALIVQTEIPQDFPELKRVKTLEFTYDSSVLVKDEQVALALSLLCVNFEKIYFEGIEISKKAKKVIEDWTKAEVFCDISEKAEKKIVKRNRHKFATLFSGGFDSTALLTLMPDDTIPIHLSFGGGFSPETQVILDYEYNDNIKPFILDTNLYHTALHRNGDVTHFVQAFPIILLCEHLSLRYFGWGHILESRHGELYDSQIELLSRTLPPLEYAGVQLIPYTNGLTEYGTAKVLLSKTQKQIESSYKAARCATGVEKLLRKKLILNVLNTDIEVDDRLINARLNKPDFANKYPLTPFLLLYAIQQLGSERVREDFNFISPDVEKLIKDWDLSFYLKVHPIPLKYFPDELKDDYLNKLSSLGIEQYSDEDLLTLEKVRILIRGIVAGNYGKYELDPKKVFLDAKRKEKMYKKNMNSIKFISNRLIHLLKERTFIK